MSLIPEYVFESVNTARTDARELIRRPFYYAQTLSWRRSHGIWARRRNDYFLALVTIRGSPDCQFEWVTANNITTDRLQRTHQSDTTVFQKSQLFSRKGKQ